MFDKPTVFILGAGASWHYGYPTGEDLVTRVVDKATELETFFTFGFRQMSGNQPVYIRRKLPPDARLTTTEWQTAADEAKQLRERLQQVNPTLIDYFLSQNEDLQDIGRLAIAMVIFDCEKEQHRLGGNPNHSLTHVRKVNRGLASRDDPKPQPNAFSDDWLRFVLYKITSKCDSSPDLLRNRVQFVTFNYDTSLERRIFLGLSNISRFHASDINKFMSNNRIFHVYGRIREQIANDWSTTGGQLSTVSMINFLETIRDLDNIYAASQGIRTIDGDDKIKNGEIISAAVAAIKEAETVFILGFGFDPENTARIQLSLLGPQTPPARTVFFTNYGGHNRVSKAAGRVLLGNWRAFAPPEMPMQMHQPILENKRRVFQYEMSTKNVYDALSQDFELLEAE